MNHGTKFLTSRAILAAAALNIASPALLADEWFIPSTPTVVSAHNFEDEGYPVAVGDSGVLAFSNPAGGGTMPTTIPANAAGIFAAATITGGDSRLRTAKTLLIYCHDLNTSDMNTASANGQLGATTRYNYLEKVANDQRQWLAVNSGGKMDSTYTFLDSGGINYEVPATQTPWSSPFAIVDSILAANSMTKSDYDYIQLVWDDMSTTYVSHLAGSGGQGGVGDGTGTQVNWAFDYARHHEIGHNLGFNHARSLDNSSATSLYRYNFATKAYEAAGSVDNSLTNQIGSPLVGLTEQDYGNPVDVMGGGGDYQFNPRDKQHAGWLEGKHFKKLTATGDGVVTNITIHDPTQLTAVTSGAGATIRYGVATGYGDTPYAATFARKAQKFVANDTLNGGKWVTGVQTIDLNLVQVSAAAYGVELRIDGSYLGVIQVGNAIDEKNFGQYNFIVTASPWGNSAFPDLVNDLKAAAPLNPERYRSAWYNIQYLSNGVDAIGDYGNLRITARIGATLGGYLWDASSGVAGAQDGSGTWTATGGNWRDVDGGLNNRTWSAGKDATFGAASGAAGTVTVNGTVTANSLMFKPAGSGAYTLTGGTINLGAGGLNAEASANIASALNFSEAQVWELVTGKTLSITGTITDNDNPLSKIGHGRLSLDGANTLPALSVYEGAVAQTASQTIKTSLDLYNDATYEVTGGTLRLNNETNIGKQTGEYGKLRLLSLASAAGAPDLAFMHDVELNDNVDTSNEISADVELGAGGHYITTSRGYFTNYDFSLENSLYRSATISGDISGTGGIALVGAGTSSQLVLSGNNTFTGEVRIERGSLHLVGADALQGLNDLTFATATGADARLYLRGQNRGVSDLSSSGTGSARIANFPAADNGGTATASLRVTSNNATTYAGVILDTLQEKTGNGGSNNGNGDGYGSGNAGAISLVKQGLATLTLSGNNTYTGTTTLSEGTLVVGSGGTSGALGSGAVINNAALEFNRSDAFTVANAISGTGTLNKKGSGTLTYSGTATYTGATQVSAGTLAVNGVLGTTAVTVASGATLTGTGAIAGSVAIANGGILSGTQAATLTMGSLTLGASAILNVDLVSIGSTPLFQVNGALTLGGTVNVTTPDTLWSGVYRLFNYTGSLTDNVAVIGTVPAGVNAPGLSIQTAVGNQVNLVNANNTGTNFWDGASAPDNGAINGGAGTWNATNANWTTANGAANGVYAPNPTFAIFQTGSGIVTVDNAGGQISSNGMQFAVTGYTVSGGAITLVNAASGAAQLRVGDGTAGGSAMSATLGTVLQGSANVDKTDLGTLNLSGSNTYTGTTTVTAGTLRITGAGALGNGAYAGTITNNATLEFATSANQTLSGALGGSGALIKSGSGTLETTAASTLTGNTSITGGTLKVSNFSGSGFNAFTVDTGGTLLVNAKNGKSTTSTQAITIHGAGTGATTGLYITGGINLDTAGGLTLDTAATTIRRSGGGTAILSQLNGTGVIVKAAASGSVIDSNIQIAGGAGFYSNTFGMTFNTTAGANTATGDLVIQGALRHPSSDVSTVITSGTGSVNITSASPAYTTDSLRVRDTSTLMFTGSASLGNGANSGTHSVASGSTLAWKSSANQGFSGVFSGAGRLVMAGSGTLSLSGLNTYSGGTTISSGTLRTSNASALGAGDVSVASGATLLLGDGTTNGVTLGSSAALALASGSILKLGGLDSRITLGATGVFTAAGGVKLDITGLSFGAGSYTLISGTAAGSTFGLWTASTDLIGGNTALYNYALAGVGTNAVFSVTVIPEPAEWGLLAAGLLPALHLVRRRRRASGR